MKLGSLKAFFQADNIILSDINRSAKDHCVNLHWWSIGNGKENIGDYLSNVVCEYAASLQGFSLKENSAKKHLYGIGSVATLGFQNATIWGSGMLNPPSSRKRRFAFYHFVKLDIRAVRGPLTRKALQWYGYDCPETYGDPAILMPRIYTPKAIERMRRKYCVVKHLHDFAHYENEISTLTTDYFSFIDRIVSSELVISSSLHGIILAESYGVPAVLFLPPTLDNSLFKYQDYYYSTGRDSFPVATTIEEALLAEPCELPSFRKMQDKLLDVFPYDLWRKKDERDHDRETRNQL